MNENTKEIKPRKRSQAGLDDFDRKILRILSADARMTYAEIGDKCGLSAPAVYERLKRLKNSKILKGTTTTLNGPAVGKPFLAFVHVDADGWGKSQRMMKLLKFPEVEEMHSVAGDTCVILKVRTADAHAMEQFLSQLYILPGVRSTKSFIVLSTYLERPVQADYTINWPEIPMPPE